MCWPCECCGSCGSGEFQLDRDGADDLESGEWSAPNPGGTWAYDPSGKFIESTGLNYNASNNFIYLPVDSAGLTAICVSVELLYQYTELIEVPKKYGVWIGGLAACDNTLGAAGLYEVDNAFTTLTPADGISATIGERRRVKLSARKQGNDWRVKYCVAGWDAGTQRFLVASGAHTFEDVTLPDPVNVGILFAGAYLTGLTTPRGARFNNLRISTR